MLCFAGQNASGKMDGEACPADGFGTRSFVPGSCSDRPRTGTASSGLIFTPWTFKIWRKSRTKASFLHLPLPLLEGRLARKLRSHIFHLQILRAKASFWYLQLPLFGGGLVRKLRFHIFNFQILQEVSHESFAFIFATSTFWGTSRTKASFSHLPPSDFEGSLARKLRFHIFNFHFWREVSHESFALISSIATFWGRSRTKASFSYLQLSDFAGSLARKLRFYICHFHFLRDVSHESFVLTSSTFRFWGRKLRFDIFNCHFLGEVSCESFVFISSTFRFCRKSRTKASLLHLPLPLFEGRLARKLRSHIFHLQILREVAHCNGCIKVAWRRGCVPNTLVFCSWTWCIVLEWLHQGCDSDFSAEFLNFDACDFPFRKCFKIFFYCFVVEIRFWSCNFWRRCV